MHERAGPPAGRLAGGDASSGWHGADIRAADIAAHAGARPTSRRCSPRTRPRCSARASSTPSARSPSCSAQRDDLRSERERARQRGADPRPRHPAVADAHAAHRQADRGRRDRERAELLPRHLPAPDSRSCTARSRRRCPATRSRPSSAWATGSAATATATRTSAPRRCAWRCARQTETALRFYLTEVHELGAELSISAHAGAGDAGDAGAGRRARPTTTSTAATSPTGAR